MPTAFPNISPIAYDGPDSKDPLAFKHYNADELVEGKPMREHLREAIHTCVLGLTISENTVDASARRIATALSQTADSHFAGHRLRDADRVAARSHQPSLYYPSGAPSLGAFFED